MEDTREETQETTETPDGAGENTEPESFFTDDASANASVDADPTEPDGAEGGTAAEPEGGEDTPDPVAAAEEALIASGKYERNAAGALVPKAAEPEKPVEAAPEATAGGEDLDNHPAVLAWWEKDPDPDAPAETSMVDDPYWQREAERQGLDPAKLSYDGWAIVKRDARTALVAERAAETKAAATVESAITSLPDTNPVFKAVPAAVATAREIKDAMRAQGASNAVLSQLMPVITALAIAQHAEELIAGAGREDATRERTLTRGSSPRGSNAAKPTTAEAVKARYSDPNFKFAE